VGVKEACGDIDQIGRVIAECPVEFEVLSGDDGMTLPVLALGGRGVISVTSNIAPAKMIGLVRAGLAGDFATARQLHFELLPLFDALFCETNPIPVKAALELMGRVGPEIRSPLTPITDAGRERVQAALKEQGLLS
jgi:4-hydroxy-tetrahydrodipicolinate synthase